MKRLMVVAACAAILANAQNASTGVRLADLKEVELKPRAGVLGETKITLGEVIERVLANDKELEISRIQREEAVNNVRAARGAYDPVAGLRMYRSRAVQPVASLLGGSANGALTQTEWNGTARLNGITPSGGTYNLSFVSARQMSDSQFTTLNPLYPTTLSLSLTQPLWRGLLIDEYRERVQVARRNKLISDSQLRQRVMERVTQAVAAYWELDYARANYDVQAEAVRQAERQYASNRRSAEQGVLAPVDVAAAQTQVATFQQALFGAEQALTQAENQLKQMITASRGDLLWQAALVPATPHETNVELPELNGALERAMRERPELKQSELGLEITRLAARLAHDQAKPRIDAYANLSVAGLAGIPAPQGPNPFTSAFTPILTTLNQLAVAGGLPPITDISFGGGTLPPSLVGSYGQSISNLTSGKFPTAQVGIDISLPIRNRTARAQAATADAEHRRMKAQRDQLEMLVESDVRNAVQGAQSARSRMEAAAVARHSAEEQYASEQRQFQAGTSTVFLVLQRQTDMISARAREVRAKADFAEAVANLQRATAQTIEAHAIQLEVATKR